MGGVGDNFPPQLRADLGGQGCLMLRKLRRDGRHRVFHDVSENPDSGGEPRGVGSREVLEVLELVEREEHLGDL